MLSLYLPFHTGETGSLECEIKFQFRFKLQSITLNEHSTDVLYALECSSWNYTHPDNIPLRKHDVLK